MLSKSDLSVLSEFDDDGGSTPSQKELAERLNWSTGHTSRVISGLVERGYVRLQSQGKSKRVAPADVQPAERYREFVSEYPHVDFPDLIDGAGIRLLYYLDEPRTATELTERCGVSRATVYRRLETLQNVGIVGKDHSRYELTNDFEALSEFARTVVHHEHRQEATAITAEVQLIWESLDEYLLSCRTEVSKDGFHRTGPAAFETYDIPLLTRDRIHYVRSEQRAGITPADLVCHTLLIDDGTRYRTYCLLLIVSEDLDKSEVTERARHYERDATRQLSSIVAALYEYLEHEGEIDEEPFPRWEDFKSTAADYGISV